MRPGTMLAFFHGNWNVALKNEFWLCLENFIGWCGADMACLGQLQVVKLLETYASLALFCHSLCL
jgi:hypothetical protein